jgi:DNA invertase Pin-like site-specific DNA recombinase
MTVGTQSAACPGLAKALADVDSGAAGALLGAKLDRLSRPLLDFSAVMEWSRKKGWSLVALDLGVDTTTPSGPVRTREGWSGRRRSPSKQ